jgi:hypothetical protein
VKNRKVAGLKDTKRPDLKEDKPKTGRPRKTADDAQPLTLYVSRDITWNAKNKITSDRDTRPLSAIIEALMDGWVSGKFKV